MIILIFLISIFFISFCFLNYAYYILNKYYKSIKYKEKITGKEIDINEKYAPLVPHDSINYFSFVFLGTILLPTRLLLFYLIFFLLNLHLKILKIIYINQEKDEKQRKKLEEANNFWMSMYFFINNIYTEKKQIECKEIYKKYLGEDYDFSQKDFSLYISNHFGYLEIAAYMRDYSVSYLISYEVMRAPGYGAAMVQLGSFYIKREDEQSRKNALTIITKRQNDFYNKRSFVRTLVFPEGTTTNGQYIATFKRGAFISLLPVKPLIVLPYKGFPCTTNRFFSFIRTVVTFKRKIVYGELPIIKPTNYMFEKYKNLGKEKWEIFANVVNNIYAEIGGFKHTNIRYRDRSLYFEIAEQGFYIDK